MALGEFDLIARYFSDLGPKPKELLLGIGDDCALIRPPPGMDLAISMDTLVEGRHFLPEVDPRALGHKALAVNLSDLAAMGASPALATLSLTLPDLDGARITPAWLAAFAQGLGELATATGTALIGGDTTRGPLSICIQVQGWLKQGTGLRRSGAQPGDLIYVSGPLGQAALGLKLRLGHWQASPAMARPLFEALDWPQPRLALGQAALHLASSAIDISDGLGADLGHICRASGLGANIEAARLPLSPALKLWLAQTHDWSVILGGGDDYELCLCCPPTQSPALEAAAIRLKQPLTCIGRIVEGSGLHCLMPNGEIQPLEHSGFDHFKDNG
jgi:thiamine-monophosphate kinase